MLLSLIMLAAASDPLMMTLGTGFAPQGVDVAWTTDGCNLELKLSNQTASSVEVDWMRSTVVLPSGESIPLVPGSSSKMSSMISIPPLVVPPNAFAKEILFRKDILADGCMLTLGTLNLNLSVGADYLTQALVVEVDTAAKERLAQAERDRIAAVERTRCLAVKKDYVASSKRRTVWGAGLLGVGLTGLGTAMMISGAVQDAPPMIGAGAVMAVAGAGGGTYFYLSGQGYKKKAAKLGC